MIKIAMWFDAEESINEKMFEYLILGMSKNPTINFYIFTNAANKFNVKNYENISVIEYQKKNT